ncbi:hypothetical protein CYMTET_3330 [Cymbomonas tetramitiformis]|uniref:Uncharacterized protein n=1 Tax=Cymbomonas tetramitiformis TaxID=36881 RepID=A0AAE0H3D2_9CHLO|nr:hypothetical protein CYMTET_3330 [Cymbomonas tetramitiformis]
MVQGQWQKYILAGPDLQSAKHLYYNTSAESEELNPATGTPRPFAPRDMPGRRHGQPFFIDASIGARRAQEVRRCTSY